MDNDTSFVVSISYDELTEALQTKLRSDGTILPGELVQLIDIPIDVDAEGDIEIEVHLYNPDPEANNHANYQMAMSYGA